jgi:rhodanese-related sulfurtransferase
MKFICNSNVKIPSINKGEFMNRIITLFFITSLAFTTSCSITGCSTPHVKNTASVVSGELINGFRVLNFEKENHEFIVYRGDYIKFKFPSNDSEFQVAFPSLQILESTTGNPELDPYIKMKKVGSYNFIIDDINGKIHVKEYESSSYKAVYANEANNIINNIHPIILDVRTSREYHSGHLQDAILIPVHELQARIYELNKYKDNDILIYCRSGNRSTVASKMLIDNGFKRIYNMRDGIKGWNKHKFQIHS